MPEETWKTMFDELDYEIVDLEEGKERIYQMVRSAKVAFEELFPNLDFEEDFLQNQNIVDIDYLLDTVEKVEDERGNHNFAALYKLLQWSLEGLMRERIREHVIETIRNFDENETNELISWLEENGLSYEEAQNYGFGIELLNCFLNEKEGDE